MKKAIIIILVLILLGVGGFYAYKELYPKIVKEPDKEEKKTTKDTLPKKDEPYEKEETVKSNFDDEAEEIDLKYDQYVEANGYAGASDNVYYTRNKVLYHLVLSSNKTTRLAEGVEKIESDLDCLKAYKGENFRIVEEDEYVIYVD